MRESMENLRQKFLKWKEAFESKGLKANLRKSKVMVSDFKGEIFESKVGPYAACNKKVMANSLLCRTCYKLVDGRCAKMKGMPLTLAEDFVKDVLSQ